MATAVADVVSDVKDRLLFTASTGGAPSDTMLGNWTRAAAKYCFGVLQPPTLSTGTVAAGPAVTVTADIVYFVAMRDKMLLPSEWEFQDTKVQLQKQVAETGDTATVWLYAAPAITSVTTSVESTCIFGPDWLEELITMMVAMQAELRLGFTAPSGDSNGHQTMMRVLQDERDRLLKPYMLVKQNWLDQMNGRVQARAAMGDPAYRESPLFGFRNRTRVTNRLTGRG